MSGFQQERDKLVSDIAFRTGPATRLIPEMTFVCNGTIAGYTVAMRRPQTVPLMNGEQLPMIQIWRESKHRVHSYHEVGLGIPVGEAQCVGGFTEVADNVFDCDLIERARILVQFGDILGLRLPPENVDTGVLSFARVAKGPLNYIFEQQALQNLPSPVILSDSTSQNFELLQITLRLEMESGIYIIN